MQHDLTPLLRATLEQLRLIGARSAVVGGLAVGARSQPRFTKDVDFAVAVGADDEAERILGALHRSGFRMVQELDNREVGRLATARLVPPAWLTGQAETVDPVIDLLFAASGIEPEVVATATPTEVLPGLIVPTAARPHLIAMKCVAATNERRLMDRQDLVWLIQEADDAELTQARELIGLINQRGYNPGHDLDAILDDCIRLANLDSDDLA